MTELLYKVHLIILTQHSHQHHTRTHIHAGDLRLAREASGGGAGEAVTEVLIDLHKHRRGGGEGLLKRQAGLLRDMEQHWDAAQGDFEIAKIHLPHGETLTHTHTFHKICGKWRFSAVFTMFGIWWVQLTEGIWVRVCVYVRTVCFCDIAIYSNCLCLCVCFLSLSVFCCCWPVFILINPWYVKCPSVSARKCIFLFSVCRSFAVCDILGGDWAPLFTRLPQLLRLEVDLCT